MKNSNVPSLILIFFQLLWSGCGKSTGAHKPIMNGTEIVATTGGSSISYNDIQPIFQRRCSACHNFADGYDNIATLARGGKQSLVYKYAVEKNPREMPPPGTPQSEAITDEERKSIAQWILGGASQGGDNTNTASTPSDNVPVEQNISYDLAEGRRIWEQEACISCHGEHSLVHAPKIMNQSHLYIENQLQWFKSGRRKSFIMEPIAQSLSDNDIKNLSMWLDSNKHNE